MSARKLNASKRRRVMILERRKSFLEGLDSSCGWDLAEIAALEFALEVIYEQFPECVKPATDVKDAA